MYRVKLWGLVWNKYNVEVWGWGKSLKRWVYGVVDYYIYFEYFVFNNYNFNIYKN